MSQLAQSRKSLVAVPLCMLPPMLEPPSGRPDPRRCRAAEQPAEDGRRRSPADARTGSRRSRDGRRRLCRRTAAAPAESGLPAADLRPADGAEGRQLGAAARACVDRGPPARVDLHRPAGAGLVRAGDHRGPADRRAGSATRPATRLGSRVPRRAATARRRSRRSRPPCSWSRSRRSSASRLFFTISIDAQVMAHRDPRRPRERAPAPALGGDHPRPPDVLADGRRRAPSSACVSLLVQGFLATALGGFSQSVGRRQHRRRDRRDDRRRAARLRRRRASCSATSSAMESLSRSWRLFQARPDARRRRGPVHVRDLGDPAVRAQRGARPGRPRVGAPARLADRRGPGVRRSRSCSSSRPSWRTGA